MMALGKKKMTGKTICDVANKLKTNPTGAQKKEVHP
jgi:hypothetical protein